MPPAQTPLGGEAASPVTGVGASSNNDDDIDRQRHIEVCVRIRPLTIQKESSNSFFEKQSASGSSASSKSSATPTTESRSQLRKPGIPRPSGLAARFGLGGRSPPRPKAPVPLQHPPPSPTPTTSIASTSTTDARAQAMYAWDCFGTDTVAQSNDTEVVKGRTHTYTLDRVYGPNQTTRHLYDTSIKSLVHAAMDGYHSSILAYGQTSTGKTHTMTGTSSQPGIIPLAVRECFDYLERQDDHQPREYLLRVSYLEVYKEHIRDLLAPSAAAPPVRMFDGPDGLVIRGLREEVVTSPAQVFAILAQGEARRQVGATHANLHSSRSHVMVRIWIESTMGTNVSGGGSNSNGNNNCRVSSLSLVDLAGSESVKLTGSSDRREEGHYINKSLMTLGQVVYALSEGTGKKSHVPYRDSKLTRLLQPSLSGNAQVVLVCCISPLVSHIEESHNTFKFATRAKKIPQKATIQESLDEKTLLQSYREEIEDLKLQLKDARDQQQRQERMAKLSTHSAASGLSTSSSSSVNDNAAAQEVDHDEIIELAEAIQTMEKLILKSRPTGQQRPEDFLDSDDEGDITDDDEDKLLALVMSDPKPVNVTTPSRPTAPASPAVDTTADKDLHAELSRVQGLLGSVLKKRRMVGSGKPSQYATPSKSATSDKEVRDLRAQLERQEVTTSLRKADSSFLQNQLEEKDDLLLEVSKILEAVEDRQSQLEAENASLRKQLNDLKASQI